MGSAGQVAADWQTEVKAELERQYDPRKYRIEENKALRNQACDVVKINGRYVRPDFIVYNSDSGRVAAIYEAKTGSVTYLSGPGPA